jgi:hypothetical protein
MRAQLRKEVLSLARMDIQKMADDNQKRMDEQEKKMKQKLLLEIKQTALQQY